ncbi:ASCH domain-containing protein [Candidatus Pacearchaeota archaeon]|nr:ASCH domain-containing protein [Candidatus Pacearchaeota archaeon]
MKALSLKQPFAELILQGRKTIELRKWNTKFRGEFLIHSSLNSDKNAMEKFSFRENSLPLGMILGKAFLKDVKRYASKEEFEKDSDKHLADESWGEYGFILSEVLRFDKPICAKGKLGFWEFDLPDSKILKLQDIISNGER